MRPSRSPPYLPRGGRAAGSRALGACNPPNTPTQRRRRGLCWTSQISEPETENVNELVVPEGQGLLYHYSSAEAVLKGILPARTLRLSPYGAMRDPLEYHELPRLVRYASAETGDSSPARMPLADAQETLAALRARMRILSLTEDVSDGYEDPTVKTFGRGYARPRMWENYAGQHRGVCLCFDRNQLTGGEFRRELQDLGGTNIGPVKYTAGGFVADRARLLPDIPDDERAPGLIFGHLEEHNAAFWFLKLLDWETEYEFRFVLFPGAGHGADPVDVGFGSCLKAIVLGSAFPSRHLRMITAQAAGLEVPLCRLDWSSGRPSVEPVAPEGRCG